MKIHSKAERDMTKRHVKLHRNLDELISCFYIETGLMSGNVTLGEFMDWSHKMTAKPTCVERERDVWVDTP